MRATIGLEAFHEILFVSWATNAMMHPALPFVCDGFELLQNHDMKRRTSVSVAKTLKGIFAARVVGAPALRGVASWWIGLLFSAMGIHAKSPIFLADHPALSPDGQTLAFSWRGDIWTVPSTGGVARLLAQHPGRDTQPSFSPNGRQIAFLSDRQPGPQVYLMPAGGGAAQQITSHSEGYSLEGWYPDGSALLVNAVRDHFWRYGQRFFRVQLQPPAGEQWLFDDYGRDGDLSPDGRRLVHAGRGGMVAQRVPGIAREPDMDS